MPNNLAIAKKKISDDVEISLSPGSGTCKNYTDLPWLKISEEEEETRKKEERTTTILMLAKSHCNL